MCLHGVGDLLMLFHGIRKHFLVLLLDWSSWMSEFVCNIAWRHKWKEIFAFGVIFIFSSLQWW